MVTEETATICFILSFYNKYVQYRYTSTSVAPADFTNVANWELDVTNKTLSEDFLGVLSEIKNYPVQRFTLQDTGKFSVAETPMHAVIPVNEGEIYYLTGERNTCRVAFATSDASSSGADIPLVTGTSVITMSTIGQYYKFIIPPGCTHLLFNASGTFGTILLDNCCSDNETATRIGSGTINILRRTVIEPS